MLQSSGAQILYPKGDAALLHRFAILQAQQHQTLGDGGTSEGASVSPKLCVECGTMLDSVTGYVNSKSQRTGKLYLNSACRPCHNHRVNVVAKLKQTHPHPPAGAPCECCGRVSKLLFDHTHGSDELRRWICRECNSGIGLLGDSAVSLRKALAYLETRSPQ